MRGYSRHRIKPQSPVGLASMVIFMLANRCVSKVHLLRLYLKLSQKYCFMVLVHVILKVLRGFETDRRADVLQSKRGNKEQEQAS